MKSKSKREAVPWVFKLAALFLFLGGVLPGRAQNAPAKPPPSEAETIQELKNQVQLLNQEVKRMEDNTRDETAGTPAQRMENATTVRASSKGFEIQSADRQFDLQLKGLLQTDDREFLTPVNNGAAPGDGIYLRRARVIFDGTLWGAYTFRIEPEFGSRLGGAGGTSSTTATLASAFVNIDYYEPLQLSLGRFKGPVGYERTQVVSSNMWIENGLTQNLTPNTHRASSSTAISMTTFSPTAPE
jgi:phosphate-selective porin OprO/OprP